MSDNGQDKPIVTYEILAGIDRTFVHKTVRSYRYKAQLIVDGEYAIPLERSITRHAVDQAGDVKTAIIADMERMKSLFERSLAAKPRVLQLELETGGPIVDALTKLKIKSRKDIR